MKPTTKICLIGNPDSIHVQRWAKHFSQKGFEMSLLSYYQPRTTFNGNPSVHFVRARSMVRRALLADGVAQKVEALVVTLLADTDPPD